MTRRMLIDASHKEESRVSIIHERRLEAFDYESNAKAQLKGNIYLAKVTRVEPSLQACFVEYGGNRQGFLAFSEIHPDYYQIPAADREELMREVQAQLEADQALDDEEIEQIPNSARQAKLLVASDEIVGEIADEEMPNEADQDAEDETPEIVAELDEENGETQDQNYRDGTESGERTLSPSGRGDAELSRGDEQSQDTQDSMETDESRREKPARGNGRGRHRYRDRRHSGHRRHHAGRNSGRGNSNYSGRANGYRRNLYRGYKIQEVIKKRQILLVQVVKEERGAKGAALTTYLSLAGRYCVLMPNTTKRGGVSRKIGNIDDRKRLKSILNELEIPQQMAVILRTAGAERSKVEIKRDYEYLSKLWNDIRQKTLDSVAPTLINEEGNIVKRAIRDLYTRDIDEVLVAGEKAYRTAKDFMKTLIPSHAKKVKLYKDDEDLPLFHKYEVERQLSNIYAPRIELRSGGSIVLHQTEALVSIDVNSGKATSERHIEETALKTNLEAAEEIARQLRLRDLAGLLVIDFIDMDERRNDIAVERRLKDALKIDRARIQVGRISDFGLLEMSRQRLRPSLQEATSQPCDHCGGTGYVIADESAALNALRAIEEEAIKRKYQTFELHTASNVALFLLNYKRTPLNEIEEKYNLKVVIVPSAKLIAPAFEIHNRVLYGRDEDQESFEAKRQNESDHPNMRDDYADQNGRGRKKGRRHGRNRKRDYAQDENMSDGAYDQADKIESSGTEGFEGSQSEKPSGPPVVPKIVNFTSNRSANITESTIIDEIIEVDLQADIPDEPPVKALEDSENEEFETPKKPARKPRAKKAKANPTKTVKKAQDDKNAEIDAVNEADDADLNGEANTPLSEKLETEETIKKIVRKTAKTTKTAVKKAESKVKATEKGDKTTAKATVKSKGKTTRTTKSKPAKAAEKLAQLASDNSPQDNIALEALHHEDRPTPREASEVAGVSNDPPKRKGWWHRILE